MGWGIELSDRNVDLERCRRGLEMEEVGGEGWRRMKKVKKVELDCGAGSKHLMWELLKIIRCPGQLSVGQCRRIWGSASSNSSRRFAYIQKYPLIVEPAYDWSMSRCSRLLYGTITTFSSLPSDAAVATRPSGLYKSRNKPARNV